MSISLDEIISIVVKEVIAELARRGIQVENGTSNNLSTNADRKKTKMDLSEYKSPLLTESHILKMDSDIVEIEVPVKTIVTPSAQDLIRKRRILITKK